MVTFIGVGNISEQGPVRPLRGRDQKRAETPMPPQDGLSISPAAREAAAVRNSIAQVKEESNIRRQRVEEAKQQIEDGTYRLQAVVSQVAARIGRFL